MNWDLFTGPNGWATSYKIEPVGFPFVADCSQGDCGNANSTTRNLNLPDPYIPSAWMARELFSKGFQDDISMSDYARLASTDFTLSTPPVGRDLFPHTALKHTYYLHCGSLITDPVIDSFSFVIDHTRGMTSKYPYTANNDESDQSTHDIAIHTWVIYPTQPFLDSPPQTSNSMGTINFFPYPDAHYFPGICSALDVIPGPNDATAQAADADLFARPSPYSLRGFMLARPGETPFSGYAPTTNDPMDGVSHTYYLDYNLDLTTINPSERIIYNPSGVFITTPTTAPIVFPTGYTFQTVGATYPTATEVNDWNPNLMVPDNRDVYVHGDELHLTDNPDTEIDDAHSFYTVTENSMMVIERCVTIWDAEIIVENNATLEYWPDELYGNVVITDLPGSILIPHTGYSTVACPYVCTEADLYNDDQYHVNTNTSFTTSNIATYFPGSSPWSAVTGNTVRFSQALVVHSGYTLTVGAGVNLEFGPNAGIIVEKGARLIVNGSSSSGCKLGPACQMEWQGVQVLGDRTLGQGSASTTPQGYLELNYCTLEHARDGITVGDYYTYGTEGGVIRAYNSQFLNNVRDVQFLSYRNFGTANYTLNNISIFSNCDFKTTEYFYDPSLYLDNGVTPTSGIAHVTMYDVKNVQFNDCEFANTNPGNYKPHLRGTAIYGLEAGLRLYANYPCTFEGLSNGVHMQSSGFAAGTVHIAGGTFENNIHSIVLEGTFFSLIYSNDFDVPESPQHGYASSEMNRGYDKPVGVYMIGSTDFRIEDNNFNVGDNSTQISPQNDCSDCSYNIVVHESAVTNPFTSQNYGSGTVYHNVINHASMGVQVQGHNGYGGPSGSTYGLQVMCNDFEEMVNYDFILNGDNNVYSELANQGNCLAGLPELLAGNEYLSSCTSIPDNQIYAEPIFTNGPFDYNEALISNYPQCYNINVQTCAIVPEANPCSSRITLRPYIQHKTTHYNNLRSAQESAANDLSENIDGGDTEQMIDDIKSQSGDELYTILEAASPWLSDEAMLLLVTTSYRENLSEEQLVDILCLNGRLSPVVYDAVLNADPAFESESMTEIENAQEDMGVRELKEREWAAYAFEEDLAANEIAAYAFQTDSLGTGITALQDAYRVPELQNLFLLQLAAREFDDADITLGIIVTALGEESAWTLLAAISLAQQEDDRCWLSATSGEIEIADSIYSIDHERAICARVISTYYSGELVARSPIPLPTGGGSRFAGPTDADESGLAVQTMQVFPNPTSGMATVLIPAALVESGSVLEITNTLGQLIERIPVTSDSPIQLDLNQYAEGMLYLRLTHNDTRLASEKLLIIK